MARIPKPNAFNPEAAAEQFATTNTLLTDLTSWNNGDEPEERQSAIEDLKHLDKKPYRQLGKRYVLTLTNLEISSREHQEIRETYIQDPSIHVDTINQWILGNLQSEIGEIAAIPDMDKAIRVIKALRKAYDQTERLTRDQKELEDLYKIMGEVAWPAALGRELKPSRKPKKEEPLTNKLTDEEKESGQEPNPWGLTPTETWLFKHLPFGESDEELGKRLSIPEDTVKYYMKKIFEKTGVEGRLPAASLACKTYGNELAPDNEQTRTPSTDSPKPKPKPKPKPNAPIYERVDTAYSQKMFRSDAERALPKVDKVLRGGGGHPEETQRFILRNPEVLEDLLNRGIISKEDYDAKQIDRAAVAAAMLIKSDHARSFLDKGKAVEGMEIIRNEERKYLQRLAGNTRPS